MSNSVPILAPPKSKPNWYLVLTPGLAVLFLYMAIRKVSWNEVIVTLRGARLGLLALGVVLNLTNYFIRSQRWGILLSGEKKIPVLTMFWTTGLGYLGNNFLPLRAGEVIRSVALGQKTGISKVFVIASALTERVLDALALIAIGLLMLPSISGMPAWLGKALSGIAALSLAALVGLLLASRFEKAIQAIIQCLPLQAKLQTSLERITGQFIHGAQAFQHLGRAAGFTVLTGVIWLVDGFGTMIAGRAFYLNFSLPQALLLIVVLGLSSAIPSTPGYIGVYQFVAVTVLASFGYTQSQALAYILVAQGLNLAVTLVWGLVGLWRLGIQPARLKEVKS